MGTSPRPSRAVFVLVLGLLVAGCTSPVAAALDESDANRVVLALDRAGIDATKEADPTAEGKFRVLVSRDETARALATMADEQLPRPKPRGLLEAADRGQLVPSQAAEHAQLVAGLAGELERTLSGVDGVLSARVHLNLPARDPLRDGPPAKATASVLIEHHGSTPPLAPEAVQRLVAGGAPRLAPADVAVVFVPHVSQPASAHPGLAHVGPIAVAPSAAKLLKGAFAGIVLLVVVLVGVLLGLYAKLARVRREQEDAAAAARSVPRTSAMGARPGPGPHP